jgi:hypothetical protein
MWQGRLQIVMLGIQAVADRQTPLSLPRAAHPGCPGWHIVVQQCVKSAGQCPVARHCLQLERPANRSVTLTVRHNAALQVGVSYSQIPRQRGTPRILLIHESHKDSRHLGCTACLGKHRSRRLVSPSTLNRCLGHKMTKHLMWCLLLFVL